MSLRLALSTIKIEHTLFALPMALTGMLLATGGTLPAGRILGGILMCMVGGRSAAMGLNRLIDAAIDAKNPRTAMRDIPQGLLSRSFMRLFIVGSVGLFVLGAAICNWLTLLLAPVALAFFVLYPYTKRFTSLSHFVLGACLGAAPVGAAIAVRAALDAAPLVLGIAVLLWVSGFDILYSLQDEAFDRAAGLHSVPVALGGRGARWLARGLHLAALAAFAFAGALSGLDGFYLAGVAVAAILMAASHWLVRSDLGRIDAAFFTCNSWLSVVVFAATVLDVAFRWLRGV